MLSLPDELLLLAMDSTTGKVPGEVKARVNIGLAAGQLVELAIAGRISMADKRIAVLDRRPCGDPELDAALADLADNRRGVKPAVWLKRRTYGLLPRYRQRLVFFGMDGEVRHRVLLVFHSMRYPVQAVAARDRLWQQLHELVMTGTTENVARVAPLGALVHVTRLDFRQYPGRQGKAARERLGQLANGSWVVQGTEQAIRAVNDAAAMIAVNTINISS